MYIQKRITQLMDERGWTAYKLAKESGLSQSTLSKIFERNNAPTHSTVEAICGAFGITLSQFYATEGEAVVLTPEQARHLQLWGTLTEKQQDIIDSFIRTL